jgi:hypothetical protein
LGFHEDEHFPEKLVLFYSFVYLIEDYMEVILELLLGIVYMNLSLKESL